MNLVKCHWRTRTTPLEASACLLDKSRAEPLAKRLNRYPQDRLSRIECIILPDDFILLGVASELPWVDGIEYYGIHPSAPTVLLPTNEQPDIDESLIQLTLQHHLGRQRFLLSPKRTAIYQIKNSFGLNHDRVTEIFLNATS